MKHEKQNRFVTITTCFNVDPYIRMNIMMNKFQSYENALFVYIDDGSTDGTLKSLLELTKGDDRFIVIENPDNGSCGKAFMHGYNWLKAYQIIDPEDIITEIDGDDWLAHSHVLQYLDGIYQDPEIFMSHGQYQMWPEGSTGGHYNVEINDRVDMTHTHRQHAFPFSHLRTFKAWLLDRVTQQSLIDPATGEIFSAAWDLALCIPMVEMVGKKHIFMSPEILYSLNRHPALQNESSARLEEQKAAEQKIRKKPPYERI